MDGAFRVRIVCHPGLRGGALSAVWGGLRASRWLGPLTIQHSRAIVFRSQVHLDGPGRAHIHERSRISFPDQTRTAPVRMRPWSVHRTRSRWSITPFPARQKAQEHEHHDVPFRHIVRHRTSLGHAPPTPPRIGLLQDPPPVLPDERLYELPRRRSDDRRRPVPRLRLRPPTELGTIASSRPPGCARRHT